MRMAWMLLTWICLSAEKVYEAITDERRESWENVQ